MKKKLYIFIFCSSLAMSTAFSQTGINTQDPKAVLHSKTQNDSVPVIVEDASGQEVLRVVKDGKVGIGTENPQRTLHTKDASIRLEGLVDKAVESDEYGMVIVSDEDGNVEKVPLGLFITTLPTVKDIKYSFKTFKWDHTDLATDIESRSTMDIGGLRIRYSPTVNAGNYGVGYIQIQLKEDNFFAVAWEKSGGGFPQYDGTGQGWVARYFNGVTKGYPALDNTNGWITFQVIDNYVGGGTDNPTFRLDDYNPGNGDIVTALLVLNNTKEFYRLNFVGYYDTASGGDSDGEMTIFVEELTGEGN